MARNFRELFRWLLPSWLSEGEGGLVAFSLASMKDAYLERVYQGLVARFPSYSEGDALAEIARERGLKRGFEETHESYVSRLQAWRVPKTHRVRGTAFAALREVQIALGAGTFVRSIDRQGTEHTRDANGVEAYLYDQAWPWGTGPAARFWIEIQGLSGAAFNTYTTSSDLWTRDDGKETVGIDGVSPRRLSDVRDLFAQAPQWKPAGSRAVDMIVNITGGVVTPDPAWETWSKIVGGVAVKARDDQMRFVQLTPTPYPGDPTRFAESVTLPTGAVYSGDPTNAAAWGHVEPPRRVRGAAVAPRYIGQSAFPGFRGDPANPIGIVLPDDGDSPLADVV